MSTVPDWIWIRTPDDLDAVLPALTAAPWLALDSESNSFFVYRERVCLIQLNAGGRLMLIDTLSLPPGPEALASLAPLLTDPTRPKYLHGGEYDVACLKRDYGIALAGIHDTQQAAMLLGLKKTGYGSVVESLLGQALAKDHSRYDWGRRPIADEAVAYAVDDVRHLPQIADLLQERIRAADLEEEYAIANQAVENTRPHRGGGETDLYRMPDARDQSDRTLAILVGLMAWREAEAQRRDLPPGRVVPNELLVVLARRAPTNFGLLRSLKVPGWLLSQSGESLITAVKAAIASPPTVPARPTRVEISDEEHRRETRLKDWRRQEAAKRQVPLAVVLPAKALDHLKRYGDGDLTAVPQLGGKRIRMYGDKLRELIR